MAELFGIDERSSNSRLEINSKNFKIYANSWFCSKVVEQNLTDIFKFAHKLTGERRFIFSGGVAMNSVAINKLVKNDFIDEIIIPPSPGILELQ